jgi:hydrogenase 3 maturation protease
VGVKIIEMLEQKKLNNVLLLNTETVPEAYTGAVTDYQPTHVLILDATNFNGKPGEAQLIPVEKIGGTAVSTHSLPLTIFASYIQKTLNTKVTLLGVQPKIIDFGAEISPEVKSAAEEIVEILIGILS